MAILSSTETNELWGKQNVPENPKEFRGTSYEKVPLQDNDYRFPDWFHIKELSESKISGTSIFFRTTGSSLNFPMLNIQPTATYDLNLGIMRLAEAIQENDEQAFISIVNDMEWNIRQPELFLLAIRYSLKIGAHSMAHRLAVLARNLYPNEEILEEYIELLAPLKVSYESKPTNKNATSNMQWLKDHGEKYRGQWVAIENGSLFAIAPTSDELMALIETPIERDLLITLVY